MQYKFFRVPVNNAADAEDDLNRFLRSARVLAVHREFVAQGENSYWALAVEYLLGDSKSASRDSEKTRTRIDYKQLLDAADFALFARLREWRKQVAEDDATPVYTVFTNEQLAEIARRRCTTKTALGEIDGVGSGRLEKYAEAVLKIVADWQDDAPSEEPVSADR